MGGDTGTKAALSSEAVLPGISSAGQRGHVARWVCWPGRGRVLGWGSAVARPKEAALNEGIRSMSVDCDVTKMNKKILPELLCS